MYVACRVISHALTLGVMYLVHAQLLRAGDAVLPEHAAWLISDCSSPDDGIEYVVIHSDTEPGPLVGMFVLAPQVEAAERTAATVCQRALDTLSELAGFTLQRCAARLVPCYYDQQSRNGEDGRDMPRHE